MHLYVPPPHLNIYMASLNQHLSKEYQSNSLFATCRYVMIRYSDRQWGKTILSYTVQCYTQSGARENLSDIELSPLSLSHALSP